MMASRVGSWVTGVTGLVWVLGAQADISFTQSIKVDAGGGLAMLASEGTSTTEITGDKSRTETALEMKSQMMRMMAGDGRTGSIVRLDKDLIWNLDFNQSQYSEMTFEALREQQAQMMDAVSGQQGGALPVDAEGCEWGEPQMSVEHPGERDKFAGLRAEKHVLLLNQSCTDPETQRTCDMTWMLETWLADDVPGEREAVAFQRQLAAAMGVDELTGSIDGMAQGLVAMFGDNWGELGAELAELDGYPVRTVMQMGIGGEQCTTESGEPIATDSVWADASTAAYNAGLAQAQAEAGYAVGSAIGESIGDSIGGAIGGAAASAAARELISGFGSMFGRKKAPEPEPEPEPAKVNSIPEQITVFRIETELTAWAEKPIDAARFELPAGFSKVSYPQ
jgi:hypothetical protein